ncbi:flagellar biosynthesis protein [Lachnospiraceae bacterium ZAX-1]
MADRLREISGRILEWWKKFSTKQKALIVSAGAIVVIAMVILYAVLSTPTLITLKECTNTAEAAQIKEILDTDKSIKYELSSNGLVFSVDKKDEASAAILLGKNDIQSEGFAQIGDVFTGGFSVTESDKNKRYQLYLEEKIAEQLKHQGVVESATVNLSIPPNEGTILAKDEDTYAGVTLELSGELDEAGAEGIAKFIATSIGNKTTEHILIFDTASNVLFSGGDSSGPLSGATNQLTLRSKTESMVKGAVKDIMLGTDIYDNVEIGLKLAMDFNEKEIVDHNYYLNEGDINGPKTSESQYDSEATGGAAAPPGTDANDETTYVMEDNATTSSTIADRSTNYAPSEKITTAKTGTGDILYDESSITVVASTYRTYQEDALREGGQLEGTTFDEFVEANRERVKQDVDADFVQMVSKATGIAEENVKIVAYEIPFFQYSKGSGRDIFDYLPILLAVLIMGLLGFVVFRSTRKEQVAVTEPELSVENLLETTKIQKESLEDIGFSEKSETRLLIEKFVDENPEAVASLLRNWLNEEWD